VDVRAAFLAWKGGEYADRVKATGPAGTVTKVRDADTIEIDNDPTGIRWLGINAPEIAHGPGKPAEYMGPEGAAWQTQELLGRTVRLVYTHDKGGPLVKKDIHGRDLAYVETLPRPFDKLLAIPGLGKLIPAQDQMGKAGNIAAQAWNALLAVGGARDFNQQASQNPAPRKTHTPKGVRSEAERRADEVVAGYQIIF
jgi:hypothetical protein